jgi:nucleotide-binding universal stress UspA family protein
MYDQQDIVQRPGVGQLTCPEAATTGPNITMHLAALPHILVAVDGSAQARQACSLAAGLAHACRARLTALHIAMPVPASSFVGPGTRLWGEAAMRANAQDILEEARAIVGNRAPFTATLAFGDPAQRICEQARELKADLVVVGSRGLGAVERLLLGSVSTAVVKQAPCSVLVIRGGPPDWPVDAAQRGAYAG